jgi:hypothetical protein
MTIEIVCSTESAYAALEESRKLEDKGFEPIGITGVPKVTGDRNVPGTCILMYKNLDI